MIGDIGRLLADIAPKSFPQVGAFTSTPALLQSIVFVHGRDAVAISVKQLRLR